ncbi:hypothetical protein BXZ70DRAFT_597105 [Cristinia sonorae]|uniref:Fungal-type protein kinase domain-containing protein n=1 Tax=Cristinia sonorae TaxID=1940300 RepID=A0A8K0UUC4_9AGAR|nr:hypothetical protein BXZ70DRAFT_597105 [Cristinia sonorae]
MHPTTSWSHNASYPAASGSRPVLSPLSTTPSSSCDSLHHNCSPPHTSASTSRTSSRAHTPPYTHTQPDLPIEVFIHHVYGFNRSMLRIDTESPLTPRITILRHLLNNYVQSQSHRSARTALCDILTSLRSQLALAEDRLPGGEFHCCEEGSDVMFGPRNGSRALLGCFVHVTKTGPLSIDVRKNIHVSFGSLVEDRPRLSYEPPSVFCYDKSSPAPPSTSEARTRVNVLSSDFNGISICDSTQTTGTSLSSLSEQDSYLAKAIDCMLSTSIRQYATGILVQDTTVTLYYGDHHGILKSQSFDFTEQPDLFILVVASISNAHSTALGFSPFLHLRQGCDGDGAHVESPGFAGSKVKIPEAYDGKKRLRGPWRFEVVINHHRQLTVTRSSDPDTVTTVVPVRTFNRSNAIPLVWKYTFTSTTSHGETDTLVTIRRVLREKRPEALRHVVKIVCFVKGSGAAAGLPRAFMEGGGSVGVFRSVVMEEYRPLEEVKTGEMFKKVFVDTMKGHHWVWRFTGVLHRNINHQSVMWYSRSKDDTSVVGVLCNFEYARHKDDIASDFAQLSNERNSLLNNISLHTIINTPFFTSCSLLSPHNTPMHRYPHDLESFLLLLIFHITTHNPTTSSYNTLLLPWSPLHPVHKIAQSKAQFLISSDSSWQKYFAGVHKEYEDIVHEWVEPLREGFRWSGVLFEMERLAVKVRSGVASDEERVLLRGYRKLKAVSPRMTFGRFMEVVGGGRCDCCTEDGDEDVGVDEGEEFDEDEDDCLVIYD